MENTGFKEFIFYGPQGRATYPGKDLCGLDLEQWVASQYCTAGLSVDDSRIAAQRAIAGADALDRAAAIRAAQEQAVREHQWEHKVPAGEYQETVQVYGGMSGQPLKHLGTTHRDVTVPPTTMTATDMKTAQRLMEKARMESEAAKMAQMVGLDAFLPEERTFTRSEVLTVLKCTRAVLREPLTTDADKAQHVLLSDLIRVFERLE